MHGRSCESKFFIGAEPSMQHSRLKLTAELKCKEASSREMGVSGGLPLTEVRSKIV